MRWLVLITLLGCGGVVWDATPGKKRPISVLLYAEPDVLPPANEVLASYPRVTVEPIETLQRDSMLRIDADGCAQARARGPDYFAIAGFADKHRGEVRCNTVTASEMLDTKHDCADFRVEGEGTTSTFTITFYAATTCRETNEVKLHAVGGAEGPATTSKPEARANALANARRR